MKSVCCFFFNEQQSVGGAYYLFLLLIMKIIWKKVLTKGEGLIIFKDIYNTYIYNSINKMDFKLLLL